MVDASGPAAAHTGVALRPLRLASRRRRGGGAGEHDGALDGPGRDAGGVSRRPTATSRRGSWRRWSPPRARAATCAGASPRPWSWHPGAGDGSTPQPWARRFDVRVEDNRSPVDELARVLSVARAYEAMDEAEAAGGRGDMAAPRRRRASRSRALAPDDDQVLLWHAVGLALAGRIDEARAELARAAAVEPRAGEHLRRFAEAGHLPGGDAVLRALGLALSDRARASARGQRMRPAARGWERAAGRGVGGGSYSIVLQLCIRLFFSCSTAPVLGAFGPAPRAFDDAHPALRRARTPATGVGNRAGQMT